VLVLNGDVADEDQTIAGSIDINLWVSTDQSAGDFVVKLVDVFPGLDMNPQK